MEKEIPSLSALDRLRNNYKERLKTTVVAIDTFLKSAEKQALQDLQLESIKALAHGMAGSGGTFGFNNITKSGRELDEYLLGFGKDTERLKTLLSALRNDCVAALHQEIVIEPINQVTGNKAQGKKPYILVVDDDKEIVDFLELHFSSRNLDISVATDGAAALEALSNLVPDLIILDIMMPKLNGQQVLEHIKENDDLKHIPVIVLTSHQQNKNIFSALNAGAHDYVIKPFRAEDLIRKAESLLSASRKTILVIADDPLTQELVEYTYTEKGFKVITAANGVEGWQQIQGSWPDLVVIDWRPPNEHAVEFLNKLKSTAATKSIPFIALANTREETSAHIGNEHHLEKPFIPWDLIKRSLALMNE